jgi:Tfp pilus assembly protein PilZ
MVENGRMGVFTANRKYPRVDVNQPAVLTVRVPDQALAHRVPVAIKSISCEGVGVALADTRYRLERRATVTMHFDVDGRHFEIPGQVVWVTPASAQGKPDVGVRFTLALAPNEMRQSYAHWIVNLLRRQGSPTAPPFPSRS